jgi:nucleotide-binding universal stress UspA family protein/hemerythrin-like domain-containing protein
MYRHLLVPIDGTDLSIETVGQAVEFARTLGARITFFHALPDHASSLLGEAEVVRLASPEHFVYAFEGRARELLAKAEAAARAQGVPCGSSSRVSDAPHEGIVAAAREAACDLIFMASHGRRSNIGMMLGSQTVKVLVHTEIPVLIAATRNPAAPSRAIGIIRDEHRSLAAVLHAWMHLLAAARRAGTRPDSAMMAAIVRYIRTFPVALHHPKEDEYLFRRLRERTPALDAELEELERQHVRDRQLVAELAGMVEFRLRDRSGECGSVDNTDLEQAVERYASFIWEHLGREEGVILPAAQRYLTEEDWAEIDAAFAENRDPRFGGEEDLELRRLFSRIVNLAVPANLPPV